MHAQNGVMLGKLKYTHVLSSPTVNENSACRLNLHYGGLGKKKRNKGKNE